VSECCTRVRVRVKSESEGASERERVCVQKDPPIGMGGAVWASRLSGLRMQGDWAFKIVSLDHLMYTNLDLVYRGTSLIRKHPPP